MIIEGAHYNRKELKNVPREDPTKPFTKEDLIFGVNTQPANEDDDEEEPPKGEDSQEIGME